VYDPLRVKNYADLAERRIPATPDLLSIILSKS
jgi:hypothetical protein